MRKPVPSIDAIVRRKSVQIVTPSAEDRGNEVIWIWLEAVRNYAKSTLAKIWEHGSRAKNRIVQHHSVKKIPIKDKIHPRYLDFEPLCCLSSCLVRGGCYSVVAFECVYVLLTALVISVRIHDGGRMDFWDELDTLNFNAIVTHQVSLYILALFDLATLAMAALLLYGLLSFRRTLVKLHWRFNFFSLGYNILAFILYIFALNSEGPETWTWDNVLLVIAFASYIPIQLWAIAVVKSCYDFYVLLYVFVTLAEK